MNEEKTNLTVTIRGQYRDDNGNVREVNEVYENVDSAFVNCFTTLSNEDIQYDSAVVGGFNRFKWKKILDEIIATVSAE